MTLQLLHDSSCLLFRTLLEGNWLTGCECDHLTNWSVVFLLRSLPEGLLLPNIVCRGKPPVKVPETHAKKRKKQDF